MMAKTQNDPEHPGMKQCFVKHNGLFGVKLAALCEVDFSANHL